MVEENPSPLGVREEAPRSPRGHAVLGLGTEARKNLRIHLVPHHIPEHSIIREHIYRVQRRASVSKRRHPRGSHLEMTPRVIHLSILYNWF